MRNQRSHTTTTTATTAPAARIVSKDDDEPGRVGVTLLIGGYSAACRARVCARAEHSAMTREARAIGLVR